MLEFQSKQGSIPPGHPTRMPTPALDVVRVLQEYGEVQSEFISQALGKSMAEIRQAIEKLEREGIVQLTGSNVVLLSRLQETLGK